jgi:regulator of sigma E protease
LKIFCNDKNFLKTNKFENGDSIVSANGEDVDSLFRLESIASQHPNLSLKIFTKLGEKTVDIGHVSTVQFHDTVFNNLLGVFAKDNIVIDHPTPLAQITDITVLTFKTLGSLFSRTSNISAEHLMGPAGIVKTLYSSAKTSFAWLLWLVVLININLAILNLLPFPVLDGGLIAIALLEKITGWKCIDKVLSKVQAICFAMLIGFIAYVTFFDVRRILMENRHTFELQRRIRLLVPYDN